jgi:hypothetical protein
MPPLRSSGGKAGAISSSRGEAALGSGTDSEFCNDYTALGSYSDPARKHPRPDIRLGGFAYSDFFVESAMLTVNARLTGDS